MIRGKSDVARIPRIGGMRMCSLLFLCIFLFSSVLTMASAQSIEIAPEVSTPSDSVSAISEEERQAVFDALEAFAGFMINAPGSRPAIDNTFDHTSQIYLDILKVGLALWMNVGRGHAFEAHQITHYTKLSDTQFSVRASMVMIVTGKDGSSLPFLIEESMVFTKKDGHWLCSDMTNYDPGQSEDSQASVPSEEEWENYPDGIRIEDYAGRTFNAYIMIIRDPSRVYLGLSTYNGFSTSIPGKRPTVAIEDEGAAAAINAGAFNDDGTASLSVGSVPAGLTIHDGKVVSNIYQEMVPEKGFCGFDQNGVLVVAQSMTAEEAMEIGIQEGCAFGPVLIVNGVPNKEAYSGNSGYNPRTVVGQRADGAVIFVCADGRQAGSLGATYRDMIDILISYGAVNACNMDGGSSSIMLYRDDSGTVQRISSYSVLQSEPRRMPTYWMVRPLQ